MEKNPYIELAECLLPEGMIEYFEVVKVEKTKEREFGIRNAMKQLNRQLEKVADSFGSIIDI